MVAFDPQSFADFISSRRLQGQTELAQIMRRLCVGSLPEHEQMLALLPDEIFLEPRLFTYHSNCAVPGVALPQLLYGHLPVPLRPDAVEVGSDASGVVHVPGLGYWKTPLANAELVCARDDVSSDHELWDESGPVKSEHVPPRYVSGTQIEMVRRGDPLLESCLQFNAGDERLASLVEDPDVYIEPIARALAVIEVAAPRYHHELLACIRSIVLFRHPSANSFAALGAHGVMFFNVRWPADAAYFVDEICHQGGHIVFHAATMDRGELLLADPETPLAELTGKHDNRSLYEALHGLYTEHVMSQVMCRAHQARVLRGEQADELYGRLCFIFAKHRLDLEDLGERRQEIFTETGRSFFDFFAEAAQRLVADHPNLLERDLGGQSYEFDVREYARRNPGQQVPNGLDAAARCGGREART